LFFSTLYYYFKQIIQTKFLLFRITSIFYYPCTNWKITIFLLSSLTILNFSILMIFFARSKYTLKDINCFQLEVIFGKVLAWKPTVIHGHISYFITQPIGIQAKHDTLISDLIPRVVKSSKIYSKWLLIYNLQPLETKKKKWKQKNEEYQRRGSQNGWRVFISKRWISKQVSRWWSRGFLRCQNEALILHYWVWILTSENLNSLHW
jgi:hypothetical protein